MDITVCERPSACDLPPIIDSCCSPSVMTEPRTKSFKSTIGPSFSHRNAWELPSLQSSSENPVYLTLGINLVGITAKLAGKYAEVRHSSVPPKRCKERLIARIRRPANDLTGFVDRVRVSVVSSEGAQILHGFSWFLAKNKRRKAERTANGPVVPLQKEQLLPESISTEMRLQGVKVGWIGFAPLGQFAEERA